jgi:hypothetical protein
VEKVQTEIEQRAGDLFSVDQNVFLIKVPTARANKQHRGFLVQFIFFSFRAPKSDRTPDRVAQIDLAFDHVLPSRRIGVLEIGHEHFRAGVQRVDHHFTVGRARDLNPAVAQIVWDRRAAPVMLANFLGRGQEVREFASIKAQLSNLPRAERFITPGAKLALQLRHECERVRRKDLRKLRCDRGRDLQSGRQSRLHPLFKSNLATCSAA